MNSQELGEFVWAELQEVWSWLVGCMDAVECQVRLGNDTERRVTTAGVCVCVCLCVCV